MDGLDGAHTSSRSLATLDRYVREIVVLVANLPDDAEDGLQLEWHYRTGDPAVDKEARRLRTARAALDEAHRALADTPPDSRANSWSSAVSRYAKPQRCWPSRRRA